MTTHELFTLPIVLLIAMWDMVVFTICLIDFIRLRGMASLLGAILSLVMAYFFALIFIGALGGVQ